METIEVKNTMFNLADPGYVDNSILDPLYRQYDPDVAVTNDNNNININVRDMSEYYSLSDSFLEVTLEYSKNGVALVAGEEARPCHMAGGVASCFNTSRLRVNNILVEDNQYSLHNSFVKVLTTKSKQWLDTVGRAQGIVLDTSEGNDPEKYAADASFVKTARAVYNEGLRERMKLVEESSLFQDETKSEFQIRDPVGVKKQTYTLPLSDLFSFCTVDKVLKGTPTRIELIKNSGALNCFTKGDVTAGAEVRVTDVKLWLKIVRPSLPVLAELETMYNSEAMIPWSYPRWTVYSSDATTSGNRTYTFSTLAQKPHTAFLVAHTADPNIGSRENHLRYDNLGMTEAKLTINGRQYPYSSYAMNWTAGSREIARAYQELVKFQSRDENHTDGVAITPQTFATNYPVLHFDLGSVEPSSGGYQIRVQLKHNPTPRDTTLYLVVVSEALVNIQLSNRNVLVYTN